MRTYFFDEKQAQIWKWAQADYVLDSETAPFASIGGLSCRTAPLCSLEDMEPQDWPLYLFAYTEKAREHLGDDWFEWKPAMEINVK